MPRPVPRLLLVLLAVLLPVACTGREPAAIPDSATLPVPEPDLSQMEPALARWLQEVRDRVAAEAAAGATPADAGRAFGELGQLYYTLDLRDAAGVAFDNARRLLPDEYRWVYLAANNLRESGELEAAEPLFERALELDDRSLPALIRMGELQLELNRPEVAERYFDRALALDPNAPAALFGAGQAAVARGDHQEAARRFERVLELAPQATTVHYQLAQAYRQLGRAEDAERHLARRGTERVPVPDPIAAELADLKTFTAYQVVLSLAREGREDPERLLTFALTQLAPIEGALEQLAAAIEERRRSGAPPAELARLHYVAGGLLVERGEDRAAESHLRQAAELDPSLVDARVKLANAVARQRRFADAVELYEKALTERPGDRELTLKRATALLNMGRQREAIEDLERLLAAEPRDPVLHVRLAEALEAAGRRADARERYRRALELPLDTPEVARIQEGLGDFFRRGGETEAALAAYDRALSLDPARISTRLDRASLLGQLGRFEAAAAEYADITARDPGQEAAWHGEAAALLLAGRADEAAERLIEAVARLPRSAAVANLAARLLAAGTESGLRDGARAVELAQRAFELRPSPVHAETLAMAYAEAGRFGEAVEWQQRALQAMGRETAGGTGDAYARLTLYRAGRPFRAESADALLER